MDLYGLLGYPLGHSFSAKYFAEKFANEHICAEYKNFEYPDAVDAIRFLTKQTDLVGFNVTIPHKQNVLPFLSGITPEAKAIGAVNVVCVKHEDNGEVKLYGCNSDVVGFSRSIAPLLDTNIHKRALILGTGGASKAVHYGLQKMGIIPTYVSRTPQAGRLTYADLTPEVMETHKVIVNCTPLGMYPKVETCPDIPYHLLTSKHVLYDLVYNPLQTRFMQCGAEQGATVKNGLEMLHLQADAAWEMWHNLPPMEAL